MVIVPFDRNLIEEGDELFMELCSSGTIALLQSDVPRKKRVHSHHPSPEQVGAVQELSDYSVDLRARKQRFARCTCGECPTCRDEARWEQIFQARFRDPSYYARQAPRFGSSLGWLTR